MAEPAGVPSLSNAAVVRRPFLRGLRAAVPIAVGYVPVAITFGILGRAAGIAIGPVTAMSLVVFAGAAQFIALSLIASGTGAGQIVLAVFLLNLRHLLFGANLAQRLPRLSRPLAALLAFGVTDEVFSVVSAEPATEPGRQLDPVFVLGVEAGAWFAWSAGTVIGYVGGTLLSADLAVAFATGLYALFSSIAVWQIKSGGLRTAAVVVLAGALNTTLRLAVGMPPGWAFVIAMCVAAAAGSLLDPADRGRPGEAGRG